MGMGSRGFDNIQKWTEADIGPSVLSGFQAADAKKKIAGRVCFPPEVQVVERTLAAQGGGCDWLSDCFS